jgi:hypothetical protein
MGGSSTGGWSRLGDVRSLEMKAKAALQEGKRNVFISFAAEDMNEVNLLRAQAKNDNNDIEFNDHSVREPYNSEQAEYIKRKIAERINRASVTVVYLSDCAAKSPWVQWEVQKSIELGKTVLAVYKGQQYSATIPKWVSENNIKTVSWAALSDELK